MARKSKTEADRKTEVPAPDRSSDNPKTPKRPASKPRPTAAKSPKKKPAVAKQKAPKPAPQPSDSPAVSPAATEPSDDDIRTRAYFLGERRARLSLPGDSAHDWIEARRQLLEEARK